MNNIKYLLLAMLLSIPSMDTYTGYLRSIDSSFCMDECSEYYIEYENGEYISNIISLSEEIDLNQYIDRYVDISVGGEYSCVECGAYQVYDINLSYDCDSPVECFIDPCATIFCSDGRECYSDYCGACYGDCIYVDQDCSDVFGVDFGMCDMFLGYAVFNNECSGISGCGWSSNEIDYSEAFFETIYECEQTCLEYDSICIEIEFNYNQLFSQSNVDCEFNNDCLSLWGDCDIGLGGCHYSINQSSEIENEMNIFSDLWIQNNCTDGVCDCLSLPNSICNNGTCELSYCYEENPVGCFQTGCPEGFECIDSLDCTPSSCFCDDSSFYGNWYCTEDCGGGSCEAILIGDLDSDNNLNISDIVIMINIILEGSFESSGDLNNDGLLNISDIVLLVNLILG